MKRKLLEFSRRVSLERILIRWVKAILESIHLCVSFSMAPHAGAWQLAMVCRARSYQFTTVNFWMAMII
jgi:hypothetical protein